jgi:MHS family proline/betaine transporter-like MFS transporter
MIGNGLEWYDFALYGYFAPTLGELFFPGSDPYVQLISTYGIFATGFLMRPVGGLLFGTSAISTAGNSRLRFPC